MYTVLWTQFYAPCDVYTRAIIPCYANSAVTPVLCMEIVLGVQYFIPGVIHLEYLRSAMYTILYIWNYIYSTTCVQCSATLYLELCSVHVLGTMYLVLCTWCYVLGVMYLVLCTWCYVLDAWCSVRTLLGVMHLVLYNWRYVPGTLHSVLCICTSCYVQVLGEYNILT